MAVGVLRRGVPSLLDQMSKETDKLRVKVEIPEISVVFEIVSASRCGRFRSNFKFAWSYRSISLENGALSPFL